MDRAYTEGGTSCSDLQVPVDIFSVTDPQSVDIVLIKREDHSIILLDNDTELVPESR